MGIAHSSVGDKQRLPATKTKLVILAMLIVLLGLTLRAYQLGQDQFWGDEGGQAWAAIQPSLREILRVERGHVMAMPLDYLVSAFMTRIGRSEAILRIPSMIWGTLAIPMWFLLARELIPGKKGVVVGLFTMFFLSLSVVHIQYSQEMRFYAALGFFYACSSWLLLRVRRNPSLRNWIYFVVVTAVGIYFHPYVYLVLVYGVVLALYDLIAYRIRSGQIAPNTDWSWHFLAGLCLSAAVLLLVFLPGYLYFSHPIRPKTGSHVSLNTVLQGLGLWRGGTRTLLTYSAFYHYLMLIATSLGAVLAVRARYWEILVFALGAGLQIAAIFGADWIMSYLRTARQIVHIGPVFMMFASISAAELLGRTCRLRSWVRGLAVFLFAGVIGMLAFPNISSYYLIPKSNLGSQAEKILQNYQSGEKIVFASDSGLVSSQTFLYYFSGRPEGKSAIENSVRNIELRDLDAAIRSQPGRVYLVLGGQPMDTATKDWLISIGFRCLEPNCFEVPLIRYMHESPRILVRDPP